MGFVSDVVSNTVSSVTDVFTGAPQAEAAEGAARLQAQSGREAIEFQREALAQTREDLAPARAQLDFAAPLLQQAIQDPSSRVLNNPFFQAMAGQQEQRLLASAAARGKVGSGGTGDDLQRNLLLLGNQFAQQDVGNLFNLSTLGANAAAQTGTATQQTAGQVSNLMTGIGAAQAAGQVGAANARGGAMGGLLQSGLSAGAGALAGSAGLFGSSIGAGGGALLGLLS